MVFDMELIEGLVKEKKPAGFFKQKIVMNASLAYGILLGVIAERCLVGGVRRSEEGMLLYFLASAFFLILLLAVFWGKANKDRIEAEKSWRRRWILHHKQPYGGWGVLFGYMLGAVIWQFSKRFGLIDYFFGLFGG